MLLLFLLGVFALLCYYQWRKREWKNSPPGPPRIPLLGNVHQITSTRHKLFYEWADTYGPVFRVDIGPMRSVVLSDIKLVKEAWSKPAFSGSVVEGFGPMFDLDHILGNGMVQSGEKWEEVRRTTLQELRDFGFGKVSMEGSIMAEVNEFIEGLRKEKGKPVSHLTKRFLLAVVNSLNAIMVGEKVKQDDPQLIADMEKETSVINRLQAHKPVALLLIWKWLAKTFFPDWTMYNSMREVVLHRLMYFKKYIQQHKDTFDENNERDFTDAIHKKIRETNDPASEFFGEKGEKTLISILWGLHLAGTDTTSVSLAWTILYLSKHPLVQKKLQDEINSVTGNSRTVCLADRANMPYTEAVISEVLRFSSITSLGITHRVTEDSEFGGYLIPKNTHVIPNLWYIHHNPKIWGDPENFRPERFLSEDNKCIKHEALIPFSTGKRRCVGENLARNSLFLFITNIFQAFNVELDGNGPEQGFEGIPGINLAPHDFSVTFKERN